MGRDRGIFSNLIEKNKPAKMNKEDARRLFRIELISSTEAYFQIP
jgi:hypothetical protein